ncbi:MAG: hypothetical protein GYB68_05315 [Chloroflexi bacterium]|nr:hypothetical protein [Chloroflexota bacterium]
MKKGAPSNPIAELVETVAVNLEQQNEISADGMRLVYQMIAVGVTIVLILVLVLLITAIT